MTTVTLTIESDAGRKTSIQRSGNLTPEKFSEIADAGMRAAGITPPNQVVERDWLFEMVSPNIRHCVPQYVRH